MSDRDKEARQFWHQVVGDWDWQTEDEGYKNRHSNFNPKFIKKRGNFMLNLLNRLVKIELFCLFILASSTAIYVVVNATEATSQNLPSREDALYQRLEQERQQEEWRQYQEQQDRQEEWRQDREQRIQEWHQNQERLDEERQTRLEEQRQYQEQQRQE
jgi:hypothetical protein